MGTIHRFLGRWGERFLWDGSRRRSYDAGPAASGTETWLIGRAEGARNFALRQYEIAPGGQSRVDLHAYDHGLFILRGQGEVLLGDDRHPFSQGDVIYIPPDLRHQITNTGQEPLNLLCIIPAFREKNGQTVWSEEGLDLELIGPEDADPA